MEHQTVDTEVLAEPSAPGYYTGSLSSLFERNNYRRSNVQRYKDYLCFK